MSRSHGNKIGVCVSTETVCKLSMLTTIKYIFSESLLNIESIFGFCFNHIDHNKQPQHFFAIMMLHNFEFICKQVNMNT